LFLLFLLSYTLSYVIYTLSLHDALPIFNRSHALDDIAEIGRMMGFAPDNACDEAAVDACIAGISALLKTIGIPSSLAEIGVAESDLPFVAEQALGANRLIKNNPRPVDRAGMDLLVAAAFAGDLTMLNVTAK